MLERISEHVWIMPKDDETDRPILGYVMGSKTSLLIDAGNSPDHISFFYGAVRSMGMPDPTYIAVTHWHWDHIFGLSGSPARAIANVLTNERLTLMHRWDWTDTALNNRIAAGFETPYVAEMIRKAMPIRQSFRIKPPDIIFEDHCGLRIDDIHCEITHVGGPHSEDSTIVYVPSESVLFLGDCFNEDMYLNNSLRLKEFSPLLRRIEKYDAKWFIPSHGEPMEKEAFIDDMLEVESIGKMIGKATDGALVPGLLAKGLKREPTPDEIKLGGFFVAGNNRKPGDRKKLTEEKKALLSKGTGTKIDEILSESYP